MLIKRSPEPGVTGHWLVRLRPGNSRTAAMGPKGFGMKIAIRTPDRAAGFILGKFRPRAVSLLSGAAVVTAAIATAGCSALGGTSASSAESVALAGSTTNSAAQIANGKAAGFQVLTLNDTRDVTFNQLLGINNEGVIVGYFGSGSAGHPNKGYALRPPFAQGDFSGENFPGAKQTQVIGINDEGVSVGFFSTQNAANPADDNNFGFWRVNGRYHEVSFPTRNNSNPPVNQLLGVNDSGTAVGFYNDAKGNAHGYAYNLDSEQFKLITVRGATSLTATAVNNWGTVAGFFTNAKGTVDSFLKWHNNKVVTLAVPGASATQAFGINDNNEVVGTYTTGTGNSAVTHGFTWANGKWLTVNFSGASSTTLNGVNNEGDVVGFYTDAAGNTDGLVGLP
jgi:probable HAF family extracellular repeat protein